MTVIKHPVSSEKSLRLMESHNQLVFAITKQATRKDVKLAVEKQFSVKVDKVNVYTTPKGQKRAFITFSADTPAIDVATQMGLM